MGKRGRPPGKKSNPYPFDYEYVSQLAARFATKTEIAAKLRMSLSNFDGHLNRDEKLRAAMEGRVDTGLSLREAQIRKARGSYMTICKDCGKIKMGAFLPSCPYCDELETDPDKIGPKGDHTNVKHKYNEPDTEMLKWLGRVELGQKEVIVHEGNEDKPIIHATLAEFVIHAANKKRKAAKEQEQGESNGKGPKEDKP